MNIKERISKRAAAVSASLTLELAAKAKAMQEQGIKVISFTVGEPDFNTPDYIVTAAKRALDEGKTKYTPSAGIAPLRQAVCDKLKRDNGLTYAANQVVVSNGAKQSIYNSIQALVNPGDEVIIPAPYWLTYPELVSLCDGVPVIIETAESNGFKIQPQQLKKAITKKTKAIILNSPNNPTGAVYSEQELRSLAAIIEQAGIFVISDEIYENLIYDGAKHWSIANYSDALKQRTIVVNGVSKTYAMTGWRIGYAASCRELASAMENLQSHTSSNSNTIAQYAALAALTGAEGTQKLNEMVAIFDKRRKLMIERLSKIPLISFVVPKGAFYIMVNITKLNKPAKAVSELLLEKAKIATVPGEAFGAPGFIRLCYTLSETDIKTGMDSLESFLKNYKQA